MHFATTVTATTVSAIQKPTQPHTSPFQKRKKEVYGFFLCANSIAAPTATMAMMMTTDIGRKN